MKRDIPDALRDVPRIEVPDLWLEIDLRSRQDTERRGVGTHRRRLPALAAGLLVLLVGVGVPLVALRSIGTEDEPRTGASPTLEVVCRDDGATVLTPIVAAAPDGVHIRVRDESGVGYVIVRPRGLPWISWSSGDSGLDDEFVRPVPVGEAIVSCATIGDDSQPQPTQGEAVFEVIDPDGSFTNWVPSCPYDSMVAFAVQPEPRESDPLDIVRDHLSGLRTSDKLSIAGYPEDSQADEHPWVAIERNGHIIGAVIVLEDLTVLACGDSGLDAGYQSHVPADDNL
jgi:hypothetical protein